MEATGGQYPAGLNGTQEEYPGEGGQPGALEIIGTDIQIGVVFRYA